MANFDLDAMSLEELKALRKDVEKAINSYEDRQRKEALAALEEKAREMGFSLSELTGNSGRKGRTARPAKYRHPENPEKTWSGRGRQPEWIKDILRQGRSLDEVAIR